jgi:DNA ligase-1
MKVHDCIADLARFYGMNIDDFIENLQRPQCLPQKAVYPVDPTTLEKDGKFYVTNLKVMLADTLYDKNKEITRLTPKRLKELAINNPPDGWWLSEKLDGVRAVWDGEKFLSRNSATGMGSKVFSYVPSFIIDSMPGGVALDGEMWMGRGTFNEVSSISNWLPGRKYSKEVIDDKWKGVTYKVFDVPSEDAPFEERMTILSRIILTTHNCNRQRGLRTIVEQVESVQVTSIDHLDRLYRTLTDKGAEGVMLRAPNSPYETKRSRYLLKFKVVDDAEAVVLDRLLGSGRLAGLLGSLRVQVLKNGQRTPIVTNIGTGFTDEERTMDPRSPKYIPVGAVVSFSYMELTDTSVRHPAYRGVRVDTPIDLRVRIVNLLRKLISEGDRKRDGAWTFKRKQYNTALKAVRTAEAIPSMDAFIDLLRKGGLKLDKEEDNFRKTGSYSSSILRQVQYMIDTNATPSDDEEGEAIAELTRIPEVGKVKARALYDEYGVSSIDDLRKLYDIDDQVLTTKQALGMRYVDDLEKRIPRSEMDAWDNKLRSVFTRASANAKNASYNMVGSYRRGAKDSGDVDILLSSDDGGQRLMADMLSILRGDGTIVGVFAAGTTKIMAVAKLKEHHRHLDIFYYNNQVLPFALLHATGSANFNATLRSAFLKKGLSLSERGLKVVSSGEPLGEEVVMEKLGKKRIETEEDIFAMLGVPFVEPPDRTTFDETFTTLG